MAEPTAQVTPPLPPGFTLDGQQGPSAVPPLPPGFKLDGQEAPAPSMLDRAVSAFRQINPLDVVQRGAAGLDHAAYDAGGAVTDVLSQDRLTRQLPPEVRAGAGMLANVAVGAVPTAFGGGSGATMTTNTARDLMQSALKPSIEALRTGKAGRAIQTMLDEGINVTKGGAEALRGRIDALNNEISTAIANSPATVNRFDVAARLKDAIKTFSNQVNPQADLKTIRQAWVDFIDHPSLGGKAGPHEIPVQQAQELKQGTYRQLGDKPYGELKGAEIEAQKTLARGLKEEIAAKVPGIEALNTRESDLLNALSLTERRILMDANKNPLGLSLLGGNKVAMAAFLADRSPAFKSIVARMLNSTPSLVPTATGAATGAAIGDYMAQPR